MIITCPECDTKYRYDEVRFGGAESKRVKCTSCGTTFEVANPFYEPTDSTGIGERPDGVPPVVVTPAQREPEAAELPALPPLPGDQRFSLAVIAGTQAGTVFPLTKPRVYLGRGSAMDIQIKDSEVSRQHAMIEVRGEQVALVDLGATNGTWVEGDRVDRAEIANRSEFTLGSTTLMLIVTNGG
ncbi:MAG: FHA domain-containing protein [Thermoanaerobaculales bacterium]